MTSFEETLIEFSASINLDELSDIIYDSLGSIIKILNETGKTSADKLFLFNNYINSISVGLKIGSMEHIDDNDIIIINYIKNSIISKYQSILITEDDAWLNLSDLLNI